MSRALPFTKMHGAGNDFEKLSGIERLGEEVLSTDLIPAAVNLVRLDQPGEKHDG